MTELEIEKRLQEIEGIMENLQEEKETLKMDLKEIRCKKVNHKQLEIPFD